jgi:hypothetical protein
MDEPLNNHDARKLVREIERDGTVRISRHCVERMDKRGVTRVDIRNALRNGHVAGADFEHGSWRYQVVAWRLYVVVAFMDEQNLIVVTTWERTS